MHNVYLFYPQYQDGVEPYIIQWLPYSVCAVWSYVETFDDINNKFTVKDIVFKREPYEDIVARIDNPSVCLFSNYVWNEQYNIGLAKAIKKQYPNALIVFGGPQVYNQGELFLEEFPIVDVVITNEGEYKLLEFLRDFADKKHKRIYSSSQRVTLTDLVSPYVDSNIMNWVIEQNPDVKWAMVMETNRGCPFSCTFCDWGGLTQSKIKRFNLEKVFQEIDWLCDNRIEYLYIADANFGALYERDLEIAKYFAKKKRETGYPYVINVNWYKNATEKVLNLNKILNDAGLNRGMTLSVQSLNDSTLDAIERKNMEMSNLGEMYRRCNEQGLKFYTEFIMGLPNETLASFKHGVCRSIELGCHNAIDCYPLDILRNSELYQQRDTHGFTIKTYKNIMPNQPTDVYEYNNYVIATNTMTRNDIVEAWLWLYIVFNAHHYGWTQILQKFSYKHLGITAETFYTNYFHDVIMKNDFLRTRYYRTKEKLVEIFYDSNNNFKRQ
jgi:radical SAM superfamily enzyme YgiQ (UPF0313 family)